MEAGHCDKKRGRESFHLQAPPGRAWRDNRGMHLLLPYAAALAPGCEAAQRGLALPNLGQLLARLAPDHAPQSDDNDARDEFTLSPPHERALARALGLAGGDGRLPWAARAAALAGEDPVAEPRGWVTPCHWQS